MERGVVLGKITMRTRWSIAIHDENQSEDSLITEDHFVHFADVHQRMKRNKDKIFVVKIPKDREANGGSGLQQSSTVGLPHRD